MGRLLGYVAMALLGALLFGTAGLALGSWYGGRGAEPLSPEATRSVAGELLPGVEPSGSTTVRGYRYGVSLTADDVGGSRIEFQYGDGADCALSEQMRRAAEMRGWRELRRVPGASCDGWRAERDGTTVTLTHPKYGSRLSVEPSAPGGFRAATITGTLLGAAAGAALFWVVARSRWPVPLLVGTLMTVALFPGAALTWTDLAANRLAEPVWPVWRGLAPVLVPLWLVLLLIGVIVLAKRRDPAVPATDPVATGRAG
ncbi:hypothetical protein AB0F95_25955 [Micromonospora tulbaghiae]|uniref:hypothetical protein n=1 Tax=Micromonospora tulbaghiae TaxID=479978 RepID=UPI0033D346B3